jgi:hypothetical protein
MKFLVKGVVKYCVDIGTFEADSVEQAIALAQESDEWAQQSDRARGGFYDAEAVQSDAEGKQS